MIFGGAGVGKTSLAREIARRTNFIHLDSDDYYWKKTALPFQEKIPLKQRNKNLKVDFCKNENVVLSGSMVSWGKEWETAFDLAIFIRLENTQRMERLKKRETERYGEKLLTDEKIRKNSNEFMKWANQYENPNFNGRTLKVHNDWIGLLDCKLLILRGETELNENIKKVLMEIKNYWQQRI